MSIINPYFLQEASNRIFDNKEYFSYVSNKNNTQIVFLDDINEEDEVIPSVQSPTVTYILNGERITETRENISLLEVEADEDTLIKVTGLYGVNGFLCLEQGLTKLDISGMNLQMLSCTGNDLSILDCSKQNRLMVLVCSNNQLTTLDVSNCTELLLLECSDNQLTTLDVSNCIELDHLMCSHNQLTTLDISNCTKLYRVICSDNQLTALDFSNCTEIYEIDCSNNPLFNEETSATSFVNSLPIFKVGERNLFINGTYATQIKPIAETKGWTVTIES